MLRVMFIGVAVLCLAGVGCGNKDDKKDSKNKDEARKEHEDDKKGGPIVLGVDDDKYHIRITIDAAGKKATAEFLDEKMKTPVRIDEETITLTIKEAKRINITLSSLGEKGAKSYKFEGTHERFAEPVDGKKMEVVAVVEGAQRTFTYHDH